uniref:MSP domain-containing protein n=1 Tax=Parascaris univalens TaxID=6257 RepID=A0A914ZXA7_PARUN
MILVEYDFQWCTVIFASFRFLVTPLPRLCGAGMEATKYFEKNKSAILANAKIGHISCLETAQSDAALQRITSIPSLRPLSTVSTSEVESVLKYGKFVVLRAPTSKRKESPPNQANSPEYERSPPNALRTRSIREISGAGGSEVEHLEKRAVCAQVDMRMDAATDDHFWQSSHTLRAFCYGFITSFIIMFIIILSI